MSTAATFNHLVAEKTTAVYNELTGINAAKGLRLGTEDMKKLA